MKHGYTWTAELNFVIEARRTVGLLRLQTLKAFDRVEACKRLLRIGLVNRQFGADPTNGDVGRACTSLGRELADQGGYQFLVRGPSGFSAHPFGPATVRTFGKKI